MHTQSPFFIRGSTVTASITLLLLLFPFLARAAAPVITSFTPAQGTYNTLVTLNGSGFTGATQVTFNGAPAWSFTANSDTKITAYVPGTASSGPLAVKAASGTGTSAASFTVTLGSVLSPSVGPPTTKTTVYGLGFQPYAAVDVYFDYSQTALVLANATGNFQIQVKAPASALPGVHWISAVQRNTGLGSQSAFTVRTDWAQFHNQNAANRYNAYENVLNASNVEDLDIAWTGATGDSIYSSPAVASGVAYVGSMSGKLYAFPANCGIGGADCAPLWTGATGSFIASSPAVANGVVYVGSHDNKLYAFRVGCNSGGGACTPLWTGATGDVIDSSPAVANGVVYVGSRDGKLYAFPTNCGSGGAACTPLWTGATGGTIHSSPAVAGGVVYVGSTGGLYAFKVGCGSGGAACEPLWFGATGLDISYSSPAVANGVVYVGSRDGKLYAFKVGCRSCTPLWTGATGFEIYSSPAVAKGVVYVGSRDRNLYAFKVGCGSGGAACTPLWTGATGGTIYSSPAVAKGMVYIGSYDGNLYAFKVGCGSGGATCSPLWLGGTAAPIDLSSPAVADGVVYVGSLNGALYAFDLSASALASMRGKASGNKAARSIGTPASAEATRPRVEDLIPNPTVQLAPSN